jgi:hypothetical protein
MPAIESRLKDLLDETRLAMLGTRSRLSGPQLRRSGSKPATMSPDECRKAGGLMTGTPWPLMLLNSGSFDARPHAILTKSGR